MKNSARQRLLPTSQFAVSIVSACLLTACAPAMQQLIAENGLQSHVLDGKEFRHIVVRGEQQSEIPALNIYIGGDGTPWFWGTSPAADPTPRNPIALKLMLADDGNAVFVGRPCYHGMAKDDGCDSNMWTFARYSPAVVASMERVIQRILAERHYNEVRLIGYSGGGTIARLIAPNISGLTGVLTIAANLDTEAWVREHNYLPLHASLNPASLPSTTIEDMHVQAIGAMDTVVPQVVTAEYMAKGHQMEVWMYTEFDHVCCWVDEWPSVLERFDNFLSNRVTRIAVRRSY